MGRQVFTTGIPWEAPTCQAHLPASSLSREAQFMGFSRQESWNGLPFPSPGDLPDPGIEPASPMSPAFAAEFFTLVPPDKIGSSYTDLSSLEVPIYTV